MNQRKNEIEVLNFDDLDVQELQQRLDMAIASGAVLDAWGCGCDHVCSCNGVGPCAVQCSVHCAAVCTALCLAVYPPPA
jgi:hypothetical protein